MELKGSSLLSWPFLSHRTIAEIDDDTASTLRQRAAERGMSVRELVAELVTTDASAAEVAGEDIAELDRRWKSFEAQTAVASSDDVVRWLVWAGRRALAMVMVFHYVCLAWVFFRAHGFANALAVLERLGAGEWSPWTDMPNLIPAIRLALLLALVAHFFAPRTFAWLRDRFVTTPPPVQGLVLAACALVLRELSNPTVVPFIYFQF